MRKAAETSHGAVRNQNLASLASRIIFTNSAPSRADLARSTGLNRSTISRLVDELVNRDIVRENEVEVSGPGRPGAPLTPAPRTYCALGINVSAEAVEASLIDLTGNVLIERLIDMPPDSTSQTLDDIAAILRSVSTQCNVAGLSLKQVVITFPGIVDPATSTVVNSTPLGWINVELSRIVEGIIDCNIVISNSTTAGASAETVYLHRNDEQLDNFLYVNLDSGIGAVHILDGALSPDSTGWSGSLGHIYVSDQARICTCGQNGCLEAFATRSAIIAASNLPAETTIGTLVSLLKRNETPVTKVVKEVATLIGRAAASAINLIHSPTLIFGGQLADIYDFLLPNIQKEISSRVIWSGQTPLDIRATLARGAPLSRGDAWLAIANFLGRPETWNREHTDHDNPVDASSLPEIQLKIDT